MRLSHDVKNYADTFRKPKTKVPFPGLSTLADKPGDSRVWTVSFAISCKLDFPTIKFQIFCVVLAI